MRKNDFTVIVDLICIFKLVKFISRLYKCLLWNLWPSKHGSRCHFYSCISEFKWYIARTFFLHNGRLICILNIRGTFFGNVNKQIQFLHILPFPMIPIRKKNKGGVRGPYLRTALILLWGNVSSQIHLIGPGCPRPNSALTVHKSGLKHRSSIHSTCICA